MGVPACSFALMVGLFVVAHYAGLARFMSSCTTAPTMRLSTALPHFRASASNLERSSSFPPLAWRQRLLEQHAATIRSMPAASPDVALGPGDVSLAQYAYAFGLLMHVPTDLGDVLELTAFPQSLLDVLLPLEPRTVRSVTRWHPLVHAFAAVGQGNISQLDHVPGSLVARPLDELTATAAFDTIVVHDAVLSSPHRLLALFRLQAALRPGGRVILTAPVRRDLSAADADGMAASPDEALSMADVHAWLKDFRVDYMTDEQFYVRVQPELPSMDWPRSPSPRVFLIATLGGEEPVVPSFQPDFYLTWSTNPLMPWRLAVIDSIFRHHPDARVHVYSDELAADPSPFAPFRQAGFFVEARPCNYEEVFADTPILPWMRVPANLAKLNFISDALRLALVWKSGGVYLDFDAIVLRPVSPLRNVLARELNNGMVNGAILPFDRGHPFLRLLMILFPRRVRLDSYTSGGPALQTHGMNLYRAMLPHLSNQTEAPPSVAPPRPWGFLDVYQPPAFFANAWMDAPNPQYWLPERFPAALYERTMREQYIFHIWKQMLGNTLDAPVAYVHLDSFMGRLFVDNCNVLCDLHQRANKDAKNIPVPAAEQKQR